MQGRDPLISSGIDYLHVVLDRNAIEAGDVAEPLKSLLALTTSRERVLHFRGRVCLSIDGYSQDSRELYEIREVREYVATLDESFPYWFWFLDPGTSSLLIVAASCCDFRAVRHGITRHLVIDPTALVDFAMARFAALNHLADANDIPDDALAEVSETIGTWMSGA